MNARHWKIALGGVVTILAVMPLIFAPLARAQTERRGGGASAALLEQLQQLASDRTSLQADNARLKKELEAVRKERDSLKSAQRAVDLRARTSAAELAQSTAQRESAERQAQQMKARMEELIGKFRETIDTLRGIESDRDATKQQLATRDQQLKVCIDRNLALYKLNDEVLERWDKQSILSRLESAEPFTRIARTRNENLIDDYRSRAEEQRVTADSVKAEAAVAGPPRPASLTPPSRPASAAPSPGATPK